VMTLYSTCEDALISAKEFGGLNSALADAEASATKISFDPLPNKNSPPPGGTVTGVGKENS